LTKEDKGPKKEHKDETFGRLLNAKKARDVDEPRLDWAHPILNEKQQKKDETRPSPPPTSKPEDEKPNADEPSQDLDMASRLLEAKRRARERHEGR